MRIAFYVYPTAFQAPGGGEIVLLKTREYLEKQGVSVKLFDTWNDKLTDFDILHTFGSVKDCLPMIRTAKDRGIKTVLSTICWYSWKSAWGIYGNPVTRSINLARHAAKVCFPFVPSQRKEMMHLSDVLLPNSENEARQLKRMFLMPQKKITVVPNGVDLKFAHATPDLFHETYNIRDFILCVGRIEPRKNQLGMIRALKGLSVPVVFIGHYVPQYRNYYKQCLREADDNMHFLDNLSHDSDVLASAYAACNSFLLASWLETPGLAALEAGLAGAKVVITDQGATKEYFKDMAAYVTPGNAKQIREVVLKTHAEKKESRLKPYIEKNYSWEAVALANRKVYEQLLSSSTVKEIKDNETVVSGRTRL